MQEKGREILKLQNPISVKYLKNNLRKSLPRLVLTPTIEKNLKKKLETDPVVKNLYKAIRLNADEIRKQPLLKRDVIGRRLLKTSQEMLYRINILGMVFRIEKSPEILKRINDEVVAVCNFQDWNPSHYLDVAEMSMAVALALDWTAGSLPKSTIDLAKDAIIEKGINPSFNGETDPGWVTSVGNWNQVCNGGMIAAGIAIAEKAPELAARTINRSLEGIPFALNTLIPDGNWYEGVTYWDYGASYSVTTSSILESAFGTDFGIAGYPSFLKGADFKMLCTAPSGEYFNYADCSDKTGSGDIILAWFAKQTGDALYYNGFRYLQFPNSMGKLTRFAGFGLIWLSQFENNTQTNLPLAWKGDGLNPLVIFRGGGNDPKQYYFAGKGGRANLGHGNMDAGSFIFEKDGIRWIIDPGNQDYNEVEQAGLDLWNRSQDGQRWLLLTKSNFGHSTLTVDNALHNVDGTAALIDFKDGDTPEATFDMTEIFRGHLKNANRKFLINTDRSITIEDNFVLGDSTKLLTWAIMTTAEVFPVENGAKLKQDGKQLNLEIIQPSTVRVSTIMMDPPPMKLDKRIVGLKRIEIRVPAYLYPERQGNIKVRLFSSN
jgi:hypothetical protein